MPNSMTGFARQESQGSWGTLSCEIRSVNQRYLEPIIRLPESLRELEPYIRDQLRKKLYRGKVELVIQLNNELIDNDRLSINHTLLEQVLDAVNEISATGVQHTSLDPLRLLQWPNMIRPSSVNIESIIECASHTFDQTLLALVEHRQREGEELYRHIEQRLADISGWVETIREQMPEILASQREKIQQRIAQWQIQLEDDRLLQEVALLANKADVDEELDRLDTHVAEVKHILQQHGAIGRRLDFMMQELNREANTLSSKSIHSGSTQAAVSLKVLIEQMREQIQNIE